jgi:D-serine deaminase-like pyridoxal phosphate-dependent protein
MLVDDLPTPCLLIERRRLEDNLARMQQKADAQGVALRPHTKTHKSVWLAARQMEHGAIGLTVAKVGEAEVFYKAGAKDIRIAYTVVGVEKHERILHMMDGARISFCVDTQEGALMASDFFEVRGRRVDVLVEVDCGHRRCGVPWENSEAVDFAGFVGSLPGLRLVGILTHAGQSYHGPREGESRADALRRVGEEERDRMLDLAVRLNRADIPAVEPGRFEISIGSTPSLTYFENREVGGFRITEIRPGNYVFNDAMQVGLGSAELKHCALTVLATVVSKRRDSGRECLFLDAGKKILTSDKGYRTEDHGMILYNPAAMVSLPHARITNLSEEHGWVRVSGGSTLAVGDRVRIVPNHACVSMDTQDVVYVVDGDEVAETVHVDARGRSR